MIKNNIKTGLNCHEPFATHAEKYSDMGFSIIPLNGKVAKVRWTCYQRKIPSERTFQKWLSTFPSANIGIITGSISGITVIDSDDPNISISELFEIYGETSFVVKTPRGGYHLYYKHNGEKSKIGLDKNIDLKGEGGYVVAPNSFNADTGATYQVIIGDIYDLMSLPVISTKRVAMPSNKGERNQKLFYYLKRIVPNYKSFDDLFKAAQIYNTENSFPELEVDEVRRTARSVWSYKTNNTLFNKGVQSVMINMNQKIHNLLWSYPPAFSLFVDLKSVHGNSIAFFNFNSHISIYAIFCKL